MSDLAVLLRVFGIAFVLVLVMYLSGMLIGQCVIVIRHQVSPRGAAWRARWRSWVEQRIRTWRGRRRVRVYLAGPMSGIPLYNFPAFHAMEARLRARGYDVVNPAALEVHKAGDHEWVYYLKRDLCYVVGCDVVAVINSPLMAQPGGSHMMVPWWASRGARLEVLVALTLGLKVYLAESLVRDWNREIEVDPGTLLYEFGDPINPDRRLRGLIALAARAYEQGLGNDRLERAAAVAAAG